VSCVCPVLCELLAFCLKLILKVTEQNSSSTAAAVGTSVKLATEWPKVHLTCFSAYFTERLTNFWTTPVRSVDRTCDTAIRFCRGALFVGGGRGVLRATCMTISRVILFLFCFCGASRRLRWDRVSSIVISKLGKKGIDFLTENLP
jgi:hypothetical protein